ncbi:YrzE family protein [Campylobacter concisus]|uniref:YrzE family protein n=1 Tax=Campylobacter concisus TaxID=199 RepID=UPI000CD8F8F1|nr:YrzE family protein [Campylobacter concisus]
MSYQDILDEKDESVKEASKFINFIKARFLNSHIIGSKQGRLIALLESECELYLKLNRTNYAEISKELSELKERICFVILDIKDEIIKDFEDKNYEIYKRALSKEPEELEKVKNELLLNSFFESHLGEHSANLKANFIKECVANFFKHSNFIVPIISVLCYFLYFGFETRYFPSLDSSEMISTGILLFCATAFITVFEILVLVFVSFLYQNDDKKHKFKKPKFLFFYNSNFIYILTLISFAILAFAGYKLNYGWSTILSMFLLSYVGVNLAVFFKDRSKFIIYLLSFLMILLFIISVIILKNGGLLALWILFCSFMLSFILGASSIKETRDFSFVFYAALSLMIVSNSLLFIKYTAKTFNIGDVDYKFLLVDKSALKALPSSLCDAKDKEQTPCEIDEKAVKIYDVKSLCNIGKFYYLQTKDGVKFELDSSKVISRVKEK